MLDNDLFFAYDVLIIKEKRRIVKGKMKFSLFTVPAACFNRALIVSQYEQLKGLEESMEFDQAGTVSGTEGMKKEMRELPPALRRRVSKQYIGAALFAAVTVLCMVMLQSWGYVIGFLFAGYIMLLGRQTCKQWERGKIICKRVICLKVQRIPLMKNKLIVILRDIDAAIGDETGIHNYYVPTNGKDAAQFSEGVILNIYVESENSTELLAWQAVDVL